MTERVGIPYARAQEEPPFGVVCPSCGDVFADVDETQETSEDAITKGAATRYAEHYTSAHVDVVDDDRTACCGAVATFMDDGSGTWTLCCKSCYGEVWA